VYLEAEMSKVNAEEKQIAQFIYADGIVTRRPFVTTKMKTKCMHSSNVKERQFTDFVTGAKSICSK
jgi:hypothetical protein